MEITNEIKAKVFAQYLGQKLTLKKEGESENLILDAHRLHYGNEFNKFGEVKLILKPLSKITDEDNVELYRLLGFKDTKGSNSPELRFEYYGNVINGSERISFETATKFYQFIQSKGYDIPQYLLGGKTLHESGLAIYEN